MLYTHVYRLGLTKYIKKAKKIIALFLAPVTLTLMEPNNADNMR